MGLFLLLVDCCSNVPPRLSSFPLLLNSTPTLVVNKTSLSSGCIISFTTVFIVFGPSSSGSLSTSTNASLWSSPSAIIMSLSRTMPSLPYWVSVSLSAQDSARSAISLIPILSSSRCSSSFTASISANICILSRSIFSSSSHNYFFCCAAAVTSAEVCFFRFLSGAPRLTTRLICKGQGDRSSTAFECEFPMLTSCWTGKVVSEFFVFFAGSWKIDAGTVPSVSLLDQLCLECWCGTSSTASGVDKVIACFAGFGQGFSVRSAATNVGLDSTFAGGDVVGSSCSEMKFSPFRWVVQCFIIKECV